MRVADPANQTFSLVVPNTLAALAFENANGFLGIKEHDSNDLQRLVADLTLSGRVVFKLSYLLGPK
jgi:hypothetical protein